MTLLFLKSLFQRQKLLPKETYLIDAMKSYSEHNYKQNTFPWKTSMNSTYRVTDSSHPLAGREQTEHHNVK